VAAATTERPPPFEPYKLRCSPVHGGAVRCCMVLYGNTEVNSKNSEISMLSSVFNSRIDPELN